MGAWLKIQVDSHTYLIGSILVFLTLHGPFSRSLLLPPVPEISSFQLSLIDSVFPPSFQVWCWLVCDFQGSALSNRAGTAHLLLYGFCYFSRPPLVIKGSELASACSCDIPGNLLQVLPTSVHLLFLCPLARRYVLLPEAVLLDVENREPYCRIQQITGHSLVSFFISFHFKSKCFLKRCQETELFDPEQIRTMASFPPVWGTCPTFY